MRILTGRRKRWLAVLALGLGLGLGSAEGSTGARDVADGSLVTTAGKHVVFTTGFQGSFGSESEAIIDIGLVAARRFGWTATNVTVNQVDLLTFDPDDLTTPETLLGSGRPAGSQAIAPTAAVSGGSPLDPLATSSSSPVFDGRSGSGARDGLGMDFGRRSWAHMARAASDVALLVTPVDVQISAAGAGGSPIGSGMALFFRAQWSNAAVSGESYSRVFTFVSRGDYEAARSSGHFSTDEAHKAEEVTTSSTSSGGGGSEQDPSPTTAVNPNTVSGGLGSGSSSASGGGGGGGSGGGGLSSGAVVGIAVACGVVGLALVFGLVWYAVRRRQQKKAALAAGAPYRAGRRPDDLMAEKEAGADVDVSPHSPYSDEGASAGGAGAVPVAAGAGAVAGAGAAAGPASVTGAAAGQQQPQDHPRSYTPYSDRPSAGGAGAGAGVGAGAGATTTTGTPSIRAASLAQTDDARVSVPSPTPGRATPRALTTPYAHLVEEGMTEEEIRRLEEEERQLDAAIEQAGRR